MPTGVDFSYLFFLPLLPLLVSAPACLQLHQAPLLPCIVYVQVRINHMLASCMSGLESVLCYLPISDPGQ